jgi:hypothetical protein
MTCGSATESAKIVNKMVDKFMASQRELALQSIRAQLANAPSSVKRSFADATPSKPRWQIFAPARVLPA